jgi:hypothetical protein
VAFPETLQQLRIAQDFQMARYPRLALTENARDLANCQLSALAQQQHAQTAGFAGGLKRQYQV